MGGPRAEIGRAMATVAGELGRARLPVGGREIALLAPSGSEDLLLREAPRTPIGDAGLALALADRLARAVEGEPIDWPGSTVADLDAFLLRLRQGVLGDRVRSDVACASAACGARIDVDFSIESYLAHHAPMADDRRARGVEPSADEPGWFVLGRSGTMFRLPTVSDQVAVIGRPDAGRGLARRCLRPLDIPARLRRRAEAAMEAMAPSLSTELEATCPECGESAPIRFDARWYCLRELRDRAASVYHDVDALARHYHWSESDILALPQPRRSAYAELALQAGGA